MVDFTWGVSYRKLWLTNKHTHIWQTWFRSSFLPLLPSPAWPWSCSEPPVNMDGPRTPRISPIGATEWESKSCWMTLDHLVEHLWNPCACIGSSLGGSKSAKPKVSRKSAWKRSWGCLESICDLKVLSRWIRHFPGYTWSINVSMDWFKGKRYRKKTYSLYISLQSMRIGCCSQRDLGRILFTKYL